MIWLLCHCTAAPCSVNYIIDVIECSSSQSTTANLNILHNWCCSRSDVFSELSDWIFSRLLLAVDDQNWHCLRWMCVYTCDSGRHSKQSVLIQFIAFQLIIIYYFQWLADSNWNSNSNYWVSHCHWNTLTDSISQCIHGLMGEVSNKHKSVHLCSLCTSEFRTLGIFILDVAVMVCFCKEKTADQFSRTPENNEVLNGITDPDPFPCAIAKQLHRNKCNELLSHFKNSKEWTQCRLILFFVFEREEREWKQYTHWTDQ